MLVLAVGDKLGSDEYAEWQVAGPADPGHGTRGDSPLQGAYPMRRASRGSPTDSDRDSRSADL